MKIPNIPAECGDKAKCRLYYGSATSTCVAWQPRYDGYGNALNHDPNTRTMPVSCETCKGSWTETQKGGSKTWTLNK